MSSTSKSLRTPSCAKFLAAISSIFCRGRKDSVGACCVKLVKLSGDNAKDLFDELFGEK